MTVIFHSLQNRFLSYDKVTAVPYLVFFMRLIVDIVPMIKETLYNKKYSKS